MQRTARMSCALAAGILMWAAAAGAADRYWSDANGGPFEAAASWGGEAPPGVGDFAIFDLDSSGYVVDFATSPTSEGLLVWNDGVVLDLNGQVWTLQAAGNSIIVGQFDDDVAQLDVTDGLLEGSGIEIAQAYAALATVYVYDGGMLDVTGLASVGGSGDGALDVSQGAVAWCEWLSTATAQDSIGYTSVDGIGSQINSADWLRVGDAGEGYMVVSGGGQANVGTDVAVAWEAVSDGYLTITDADSQLNVAGDLTVGAEGWGSMDVADGGKAYTTGGAVGVGAASRGTVNVLGEGAEWGLAGPLTVADAGWALVTVSGGGWVTGATEAVISRSAGSLGLVKVTDANSFWSVSGPMHVGEDVGSTGRFRVENGGTAECADASLAYQGGYGEAVVTGDDSFWHTTGGLYVGERGAGDLRILDGGRVVTDTSAVVGKEAGAVGDVRVSGFGSQWYVTDSLDVGHSGTGTMAVDGAASVSCDYASLGVAADGNGTLNVAGPDTLLYVTWDLQVGEYGTGRMAVSGGAVADCGDLYVARWPGSRGELTVIGTGSAVQVAADATIGDGAGSGTVTVGEGAAVSVGGSATVNAGSRLVMAGGTVTAQQVWLSGGRIEGFGTVDANLLDTPDLVADGGTLSLGNGATGAVGFWSAGTAEVRPDATLELLAADEASVPGTVTLTNGVLVARGGLDVGTGGALTGYGVVIGPTYAGASPAGIAAPSGAVDISVAIDVGDSDAVVYTSGMAELGPETLLDGGLLSVSDPTAVETLRIGPGDVLRGWGDVDADVLLENGLIDAEEGGVLVSNGATRSLDGYGILIGDVWADFFDIGSPKGTVQWPGEMHVGDRWAETFSVGPAVLGPVTTLDGGVIQSPSGVTLPSGAVLTGFGRISGAFQGESGSTLVATGDLEVGDWFANEGFRTDGTLLTGEQTVTLASFGPARLGEMTVLEGGTLAALNYVEMGDGAQMRGTGTVDGSLRLANSLVQPAVGMGIHITQSLSGYGIVIGDVTAAHMPIAMSPTGTVDWGSKGPLSVGGQTAWVYSADTAVLGQVNLAGGVVHASAGLRGSGSGSVIDGFGTVNAAVSGQLGVSVHGGLPGAWGWLTLGDASRTDGVDLASTGASPQIRVASGSVLELLDADEAVLDVSDISLEGGVLIARNGAQLGATTWLRGGGVVIGEVTGGLPDIYNPTVPVGLDVPLDVGGETAWVHSAGEARLGDVHLGGGELYAPGGVRFEDNRRLSGFGEVDGDVTLEGGILDADEGQVLDIYGEVSGYGVVIGPVFADAWPIQSPTDLVEIETDVEVGARSATIYSDGPAEVAKGSITLDGGEVVAPDGLLVGDYGYIEGSGTVDAWVHGLLGSEIRAAGGDLALGDEANFEGFNTKGVLDVSSHTVTLRSAGSARLGVWTDLAGGALIAANGVTLAAGDRLWGFGEVRAAVAAGVGSEIAATGPLTLGDAGALDGFRSDGVLATGQHEVTLRDKNQAVLAALTTLGDANGPGTLTAPNGSLLEYGKDLAGYGTVNGGFENRGHVYAEGTGLTFNDDVTGPGAFDGNVTFAGTYSPGNSPAVVSFGGSVTFADSATLRIELAAADNSDVHNPSYDALAVAGSVLLDGTLSLDWLPVPHDPNSRFGGVYTILSWAGSRSGAFGAIDCEMAAYLDDSVFADGIEYDDAGGQIRIHLLDLLDGDADLDGQVGSADLLAMHVGAAAGDPGWAEGDFTFDGKVSAADYLAWKAAAGSTVGGAGIPEPSALALLCVGAAAALRRRRKR